MSKLTVVQEEVLDLVCSGKCVNNGVDGFHCNVRTLKALETRGYIFYGKFYHKGKLLSTGWQPTEDGLKHNTLLVCVNKM